MNCTITQRELRNDSAAVLRAAKAGETLIITRNGTGVAELRPLAAPARRWVPRAALAVAAQHAPLIDAARLRADLKAVIDPSLVGVDGRSAAAACSTQSVSDRPGQHRFPAAARRGGRTPP